MTRLVVALAGFVLMLAGLFVLTGWPWFFVAAFLALMAAITAAGELLRWPPGGGRG